MATATEFGAPEPLRDTLEGGLYTPGPLSQRKLVHDCALGQIDLGNCARAVQTDKELGAVG